MMVKKIGKTLEELIAERDELLKNNPKLRQVQDKLDGLLAGKEDPAERIMICLGMMIEGINNELLPEIHSLVGPLHNVISMTQYTLEMNLAMDSIRKKKVVH